MFEKNQTNRLQINLTEYLYGLSKHHNIINVEWNDAQA